MLESANRLHQRDRVVSMSPVPMFDEFGNAVLGHVETPHGVRPIYGGNVDRTPRVFGRVATLRQGGDDQQRQEARGNAPVPLVPFIEAAREHVEGAFFDVSQQIDDATHQYSFDIPAYGFLRHVWLLVTSSTGSLGAGALGNDYPWSILDQIQFVDTNGTPTYGPHGGVATWVHNLVGGYAWRSDVVNYPSYVGTINGQFYLRVPVEITAWDGYGSLANLNGANPYRIKFNITPRSLNFTTNPTTAPTIRVRGFLETWSQPPRIDHLGRPVETEPPSHGTTQFWSVQTKTLAAGLNTVRLERMGNLIRSLVFVARNNTLNAGIGTRDDTVFPDPIEIDWDAHQLFVGEPQVYRKVTQYERFGFALPTGVFVYDFTHDQDGHPGWEDRHLYVPTVQATRLQVVGSSATAGQLEIYTNDIMPVPGVIGAPVAGVTERGTG